jgi:uncharacterized membrane protein
MADLVEIAFPSEEKAEQVRQKLLDMQKLLELSDAVIAVKQSNGRVKRVDRAASGFGIAASPHGLLQ